MDIGRALYLLAEVYVLVLVIISAVTVAWVFDFFEGPDAQLAGIWFAISGFGVLVLITFLLVHYSRE